MNLKLIITRVNALSPFLGNTNKFLIPKLMSSSLQRTPKVSHAKNILCTVIPNSFTWKSTSEFSLVPTLLDPSNSQVMMPSQIWPLEESKCSNSVTLSRTLQQVSSTLSSSSLEVLVWNLLVFAALISLLTKKKLTSNSCVKQ